jgi:hypothetical protein
MLTVFGVLLLNINIRNAGLEVVPSVVMSSSMFWDITFRSIISPSSSEWKNTPSKKPASKKLTLKSFACHLLQAGSLPGVFLDPEDGGDMLLRSVG